MSFRSLALVGAALATACTSAAPGIISSTTRPLSAHFLGDHSTTYDGGESLEAEAHVQIETPGQAPASHPSSRSATTTSAASARSSLAIGDAMRLAGAPGSSGSLLILRQGTDTLAVEHVDRDGSLLHGTLSLSNDMVMDYTLSEHADGTVEQLEVTVTPFGAESPKERFWANFTGDSITSRTVRLGMPTIHGASRLPAVVVPYIDPSPAMLEQIVRHARRSPAALTRVPVLVLGDPSVVVDAHVAFQGADSAVVTIGNMEARLSLNAEGRVLGGTIPDEGMTVERLELGARSEVARRP